MFISFFFRLRELGVPVTLREFLALLRALERGVVTDSVERFYYLARTALVKDERYFDRFDVVFASTFRGVESLFDAVDGAIPTDWLRALAERHLSKEEMARIEALGGFEKLMEELRKRLAEQQGAHRGGSKWIGTGGTSPFGAYGYNPEGVRIGQDRSRHRRAVKVWDRREFENLDLDADLAPRNLRLALRSLRRFAREGAETELDLDDTIRSTARSGGCLDLKFVPERKNTVKVLLFLDVGGSMDDHVELAEQLFAAARTEFKHIESFYFHNCIYEAVWKDNRRRRDELIPTWDLMNTYGSDYRVFCVGDASMSPYEILHPGAAIEHHNEESGQVWMSRLRRHFPKSVWLNPVAEPYWGYTASIGLVKRLFEERMFPLTVDGIRAAIEEL